MGSVNLREPRLKSTRIPIQAPVRIGNIKHMILNNIRVSIRGEMSFRKARKERASRAVGGLERDRFAPKPAHAMREFQSRDLWGSEK
jgi:hypothetical protein